MALTVSPRRTHLCRLLALLVVTCSLAGIAPATLAQTVYVTIPDDVIDVDANSATLADLPGPDGEISFSEAIIATNNTPGHQTIGFRVPEEKWTFQWLHPGRVVLTSTIGYYFRVYDSVTIDGTTQTAFTGDTYADGHEVLIDGHTLYLNADNCVFTGFDSSRVDATASNALVENNSGSMDITIFGGSGSTVRGNEAFTIKIDRSHDNVVVGNVTARIRVLGFGDSDPIFNNRIGGPNPEDRNYLTGYGSYNSEGMPGGTTLQLFATEGTVIENNRIGTTPDGMSSGNAASTVGIGFEGTNVGTVVRDNQIAGVLGVGTWPHHYGLFYGWAVLMQGTASDVVFMNNTIGLDANGDPVLGSVTGVDVGSFNNFGLTGIRFEGNVVAGHMLTGINVGARTGDVRLTQNHVYDNGGLGIDLVTITFRTGVTLNDNLDLDEGGSGLQNFPEIATATRRGVSGIEVQGQFHSEPLNAYTLEFFANSTCDPSGYGEGSMYLGHTDVTTDANGDATFLTMLDASIPAGWYITSTATLEPVGATSEFSECVVVTNGLSVVPGDATQTPGARQIDR